MNKLIYNFCSLVLVMLVAVSAWAGNPDRQGEAGAPELLMNPWARSAGLHTMSTSMITGAEAMRLNIAGLARINKTEVILEEGSVRLKPKRKKEKEVYLEPGEMAIFSAKTRKCRGFVF